MTVSLAASRPPAAGPELEVIVLRHCHPSPAWSARRTHRGRRSPPRRSREVKSRGRRTPLFAAAA
eukprot:4726314-Prymnesium_polylepis.1